MSQSIDFEEPDDNILEFFKEITVSYYRDMMSCLRDIGVRIPITGTNWANTPDLFAVQLVTDFTDSHTYWAPNFGDQRKFSNRMMTSEPNTFIDVLSLSRALDRPFLFPNGMSRGLMNGVRNRRFSVGGRRYAGMVWVCYPYIQIRHQ